MSEIEKFLKARDFLRENRGDYETAYREFRWPELDRFNWALDYFDSMARGNDKPALLIVEEDGSRQELSFRQLSERSSQVANYLRQIGVRRGDCILLMMGNEAPLWELMLAAIKLGAVISPATTLLTSDDLADRIRRGNVKVVVTRNVEKFAAIPHAFTGITLGKPVAD